MSFLQAPKPGGKATPGPGTQVKRPPTRDLIVTAERTVSPITPSGVEPIVLTKYKEKLYTQVCIYFTLHALNNSAIKEIRLFLFQCPSGHS